MKCYTAFLLILTFVCAVYLGILGMIFIVYPFVILTQLPVMFLNDYIQKKNGNPDWD